MRNYDEKKTRMNIIIKRKEEASGNNNNDITFFVR